MLSKRVTRNLFSKNLYSLPSRCFTQHRGDEKETHFGFETVKESEKTEKGGCFKRGL